MYPVKLHPEKISIGNFLVKVFFVSKLLKTGNEEDAKRGRETPHHLWIEKTKRGCRKRAASISRGNRGRPTGFGSPFEVRSIGT